MVTRAEDWPPPPPPRLEPREIALAEIIAEKRAAILAGGFCEWTYRKRGSENVNKNQTMREAAEGRGCMGRSKADEPVVVLCARDACAVAAIQTWIDVARTLGVNADKVAGMVDVLESFKSWQAEHGTKVPD